MAQKPSPTSDEQRARQAEVERVIAQARARQKAEQEAQAKRIEEAIERERNKPKVRSPFRF